MLNREPETKEAKVERARRVVEYAIWWDGQQLENERESIDRFIKRTDPESKADVAEITRRELRLVELQMGYVAKHPDIVARYASDWPSLASLVDAAVNTPVHEPVHKPASVNTVNKSVNKGVNRADSVDKAAERRAYRREWTRKKREAKGKARAT